VTVRATRKDKARHYEGKTLEGSWSIDGNEKGSKQRKGKERQLVDTKKVLAGIVDASCSGKEQETFKAEGKMSVENGDY
jgi:hypothetical protein